MHLIIRTFVAYCFQKVMGVKLINYKKCFYKNTSKNTTSPANDHERNPKSAVKKMHIPGLT